MGQKLINRLCAAGILFLTTQHALGAGFYISEVGTPSSFGTAGVANPTNTYTADASWTNPAGMTGLTEDSILGGMMILVPKLEFESSVATGGGDDGGNAGDVAAIPSFFYTKVLSDRARFGFSIVAPLGGGVDFGDNFVGRYSAQKIELQGIAFTPSFAYKVNDRLSLGAGVSVVYTSLNEEIAINKLAPGDGKAKFDDMEDIGFQGVLGLTYQMTDETLLGVVYRSEADTDLEGTLKIENLTIPVADRDFEVSWDNPQWLEVGVRHALKDKKTLFFNLGWQEWSTFSKNTLSVTTTGNALVVDREWDDTWHAGVGFAQRLGPESLYSLGVSYESSPVEDDKRTLDFAVDEMWKLSGSYGWKGKGKFDYAVGATLYLVGDASIDQTSQGVRVVGEFDKNMFLFLGGTLRYAF
jgi:long-chain fatty acid transport protein